MRVAPRLNYTIAGLVAPTAILKSHFCHRQRTLLQIGQCHSEPTTQHTFWSAFAAPHYHLPGPFRSRSSPLGQRPVSVGVRPKIKQRISDFRPACRGSDFGIGESPVTRQKMDMPRKAGR